MSKLVWDQSAGQLLLDGKLISPGYSGKGRGRNNPALENVPGIGPIPAGRWAIKSIYDSDNVGPRTMVLWSIDGTPDDRDARTGRSAFRIHGDSIRAPGTASRGCIILPRKVREWIWRSGIRELEVVA